MPRLSALTSSAASDPSSLPRRLLGTAVTLSTIIRHGTRSPLCVLGWMGTLKIGARVGSVVNGQTTIESLASNRSSCTMIAGRGLPTLAAPPATVQISPRFIRHPRLRLRRRTLGPVSRGDCWPRPMIDGAQPERRLSIEHLGPRSERAEGPACEAGRGVREPCHGTGSQTQEGTRSMNARLVTPYLCHALVILIQKTRSGGPSLTIKKQLLAIAPAGCCLMPLAAADSHF